MAWDEHNPEIASAWLRRELMRSAEVKAIINDRAYDDVGVKKGAIYPFVYWTLTELSSQKDAYGVYKIVYQADVRAVWKSTVSGGTRKPCIPLSMLMKKVLTGPFEDGNYDFSEATLDEISNVPGIGVIHGSKYLHWYRPPYRDDGDIRIIEHGVSIKLDTSS